MNLVNPFIMGAGSAPPVSGDIILMMGADVEPTAGGAPHGFTTTGIATSSSPAGVHDRAYDGATVDGNITLATPSPTISVLMRFQVRVNAALGVLLRCNGGGTVDHTEVQYQTGGTLRVVRNVSTVLDGPTSALVSLNTWYWLELVTTINDTTGSFTVNLYDDSGTLLNTGGDVLTASGVDTRDGGATANVTNLILPDNGLDSYVDNLVVDTTGQLYGPRARIETIAPNGAGALSQLTPSGGGSNYQQVDEVPCGTADYVSSAGDQTDTYLFPNIAVSGTPQGAGVYAACVAASGTPQFNFVCRISGVNYDHPTLFTSSATNKFYGGFWRNNPATGGAWTAAAINAAEFGVRWRAANGRTHGLYRTALISL